MSPFNLHLNQLRSLTVANLKIRYRKTWIGFLWVLLNPVILLTVQSFIFLHVLNVSRNHYLLYLISGFLPWIFLSQSLEMGAGILKAQAQTLKAFSIPPFLIIGALILENLINFLVFIVIVYLPLCLFFEFDPLIGFVWLASLVPLVLGVSALVFFVATWNVFFRDLKFVVTFLLSIAYFLTPIFYPITTIPEHLRWIALINPIATLLRPFQDPALGTHAADWCVHWVLAMGLATMIGLISWVSWKKQRNKFYLYL